MMVAKADTGNAPTALVLAAEPFKLQSGPSNPGIEPSRFTNGGPMRLSLALILSLLFSTHASAAPLEFKSLVLDAPTTPAQVVEALATECVMFGAPCDTSYLQIHERMAVKCGVGGIKRDIQVCNGNTTIAGVPARANVVIGPDGRLQRIDLTVSENAYKAILAELTEKFGKPSSSKASTLQNRFGASFSQVETTWDRDGGKALTVTRFAGSVDDSRIYFSTEEDRETLRRASQGDPSDL
jgi:hypothetical protein